MRSLRNFRLDMLFEAPIPTETVILTTSMLIIKQQKKTILETFVQLNDNYIQKLNEFQKRRIPQNTKLTE